MAASGSWSRFWRAVRLALAELIDPSRVKEREARRAIRVKEREARRAIEQRARVAAHRRFHGLWSKVGLGAAYDKRLWVELQTELETLGVRATTVAEHPGLEETAHSGEDLGRSRVSVGEANEAHRADVPRTPLDPLTPEQACSPEGRHQVMAGQSPAASSLAAEAAFATLSQEWHDQLQRVDHDALLPTSMDDLALACLLLAVEFGSGFTASAWEGAEVNRDSAGDFSRMPWIDQLPWDLCLAATAHDPPDTGPVRSLVENLGHHNSSIRVWVMHVAWMARPWLTPERVAPVLLRNFADTLGGPFEAAALASSLAPDVEGFWDMAERFAPPAGFEEQYRWRLNRLREGGILQSQAPFLSREVRCRKLTGAALLRSFAPGFGTLPPAP